MTTRPNPAFLTAPRWDGTRVVFTIDVDGEAVDCAISRSALQDIGGYRYSTPPDLLRCFATHEARLTAAAAEKFRAGSGGVYGVVSLWSDDLEDASTDEAAPPTQSKGKKRHGQGNEPRQPRSEKAEGIEETGAHHVVVPAPGDAVAGG